jgi:hypothetical protein
MAAKGLANVNKYGETWIRIVNLDETWIISKIDLDSTELNSQQKLQVARLLTKHDSIISKGDWDLGKTTKGEFKIELNDEFPIREPDGKPAQSSESLSVKPFKNS